MEDPTNPPKTNRPSPHPFNQQRLNAWQPIMTPLAVILIFIAIGVSFIPTGTYLLSESNDLYEQTILYDGKKSDMTSCTITTSNVGRRCNVTFNVDDDVTGPIYVYYELRNFYQNHRRYVSSVDYTQMSGQSVSETTLDSTCVDKVKNGSLLLNPCGLIANSYFTDVFSLDSTASSPANTFDLDESGITWKSDDDKFKQPDDFKSAQVSSLGVSCSSVGLPSSCKNYTDPSSGQHYKFYYPSDDSTQYLYETYPGLISPIDGVTDDHFKVWMRTAAMPRFRKLYGKIHSDLKKGDKVVFQITANYEVGSYDATKGLHCYLFCSALCLKAIDCSKK
eukprot:scaffold386_cov174-Ochromonas_danica.AAC.30